MSQSNGTSRIVKNNIVRVKIGVEGIRPLLQHAFGPESIPLEKQEKEGVAGNDPNEWRKSMMVNDDGVLYIRGSYAFGCLRNASKHTKKGRSSIMSVVEATLEIEEQVILLSNRTLPEKPRQNAYDDPVYIDVRGVVNKATKGRNVRYRLAASPGWLCEFTIQFDRTLVSREQMKAVVHDAGRLQGLGDALRLGCG